METAWEKALTALAAVRRFTSRGTTRANAEWLFHGIVHNISKAINTGMLTLPNTT